MKPVPAIRRHWLFLTLLFLFYGTLLDPRFGFVRGDYERQVYPWLHLYAQELKLGVQPLWTDLIQSGFPLFAEGQTAMLYLPQVVLFGLLPFEMAYNALNLFHYAMAGAFFYALCRRNYISGHSASLVSTAYVFGSAAGGGLYGLFSLRVLVWFPVLLLASDWLKQENGRRQLAAFFLSVFAMSQMWVGGYPQMALYATAFTLVYFWVKRGQASRGEGVAFFASVVLGFLLAWPQIAATAELASHSIRLAQDKSLYLSGSAAPWAVLSLFYFPTGFFSGAQFYAGLLLFLVIAAVPSVQGRRWWLPVGLAGFLALGLYNPFYHLLGLVPGIASSFRMPAKFLFFATFFLLLLAGTKLDTLWEAPAPDRRRLFKRIAAAGFVAQAVLITLAMAVRVFKPFLLSFGEWYVRHFVAGKSYHRKPVAEYLSSLDARATFVQDIISPAQPAFWFPVALAVILVILSRSAAAKKKEKLVVLLSVLLAGDLCYYGLLTPGTSPVGNIGRYEEVARPAGMDGRILEVPDLRAAEGKELLFPPNRNILVRQRVLGVYSPLADRSYADWSRDFSSTDDSFGRAAFSWPMSDEARRRADFLGVGFFVSPQDAQFERAEKVADLEDRAVWKNLSASPDAAVYSDAVSTNTVGTVLGRFIKRDVLELDVDSTGGTLVWNAVYDPGWKATLDGETMNVFRAREAFVGVDIPSGRHQVVFTFKPGYGRWIWLHFLGVSLALFGALALAFGRPSRQAKDRFYAIWLLLVFGLYAWSVILPKILERVG